MNDTTDRLARVLAVTVLLTAIGCFSGTPSGAPTPVADPADPPKKDKFAEDRVPKADPAIAAIDGERSVKYVKELCDIGPRVSATDGMTKQQDLLIKHFEKLGATVTRQEFLAKQRSKAAKIPMTNLIFSWYPDRKKRVIFCTHYDTRPAAHEEPEKNWNKPFVSANDGTAGVALLMELAHQMKAFPTEVGVDFVLFDGEEYILDPGVPYVREGDKFFLGSEYFAAEYAKTKAKSGIKYEAAILLDLCGHEGARLAVEGYSYRFAPKLLTDVWKAAESVGAKSFKYERGFHRASDVLDDHIALNEVGIPAIDIIDFDYKHWHKLDDTPDKISPKQQAEVGTVLLTWLKAQK